MTNDETIGSLTFPNERVQGAPRHIAIVMDGNGRWALQRGKERPEGHVKGASVVNDVVRACSTLGVERLTLYCFSSENWKRPQAELDALMTLLADYMVEQRGPMMRDNIRLRVIGRREGLPERALKEMDETIRLTSANTGLTLALAINYGARAEIVDAVKAIVKEASDPQKRDAAIARAGVETFEDAIDERYFASKLYDGDAIDPDLFIRTGGERRLSNYLLWELSYAELWFTDVLWPDFTQDTLWEAVRWFLGRKRRYGGL